MGMVKKSITVTDQQDHWIKSQIEKGHSSNESEVVRELIRERQLREQESNREIEVIRTKLIQAEASGFTEQLSADPLPPLPNLRCRSRVHFCRIVRVASLLRGKLSTLSFWVNLLWTRVALHPNWLCLPPLF